MSLESCTNQQFTMFEGNTRILNFLVTNEEGTNVDIDDAQASIFALFDASNEAEVFRAELLDGITLAGNVVTVTIPSDSGLLMGEYIFELQLTDITDGVHTLAQGTATVKESYIS